MTCKRPLPDGTTQDKAPRYFGQYSLLPEEDDGENWAYEVDTIIHYIQAVAELAEMVPSHASPPYYELLSLIYGLSQEAARRNELCREALAAAYDREQAAKKAPTHAERGA